MAQIDAELQALKKEAMRFVRNPLDTLLPGLVGPLFGAVAKGPNGRAVGTSQAIGIDITN